jgi:hypothetical protein
VAEPTGSAPSGPSTDGPARRALWGLRARLTSVASAPWLKAPILGLRFPGLLVASASAVLILGVASAAGPLFLSSAGNATLQRTLAETCPWAAGLELQVPTPLSGEEYIYFGLGPPPAESGRPALVALNQADEELSRQCHQARRRSGVRLGQAAHQG